MISQDADGYLEAESRWEKVAKKAPDNYLSMLGIAKASFKKKEFEKGKKILEKFKLKKINQKFFRILN